MKAEELDEMQHEWITMLAKESAVAREDEEAAIGRRFISCCGAFLAFMSLDGETREKLRSIIRLSKSSEEAKEFARLALYKAFSENNAQPAVG